MKLKNFVVENGFTILIKDIDKMMKEITKENFDLYQNINKYNL